MRTAFLVAILVIFASTAAAYREGHEGVPPDIAAWFARQKQPDNPIVSCCGDYDAYEADEFITEKGKDKDGKDIEIYIAIITNGKNDLPPGTRVVIPPQKMPRDNHDPNPSGHGVVYMSISRDTNNVVNPDHVYCYFPPVMG